MANETIEDAWNEMKERVREQVPPDDEHLPEIVRAAFYVGSYAMMMRVRDAVARLGPIRGMQEVCTDTEAEFAEFRQRVKDTDF